MYKTLLASGCSFTYEPECWPTHVASALNCDLVNVGLGSMGNTLIARRAITQLHELLKTNKPEEILVGIMWTGTNRIHRFVGHKTMPNIAGWIENPTHMWPDGAKVWEIGNNAWDTEFDKIYLKYVHSWEDGFMNTIDNILLIQNYLKSLGVNYFMSNMLELFKHIEDCHIDVIRYSKLIDLSTFADTGGCYEWCINNQKEEEYTSTELIRSGDLTGFTHPTEEGHKAYVENVLLPFIKEKL